MPIQLTKEEFNKLPQLDRIEFRQRDDRITFNLVTVNYIWMMFYIIGFIIIASLLIYIAIGFVSFILFIKTLRLAIIVLSFGLVICIAIDILTGIKWWYEKKELYQEYRDKLKIKRKKR